MKEIIEGLLRLAQASRVKPRYAPLDLAEIARAVVADLQTVQPERSVQIVIPPSRHCRGDRQLLQTALENLPGQCLEVHGTSRGCAQSGHDAAG